MGTKVQHLKQYSPIPALLRAMREDANLSQRELAVLLDGKTQTYIQYCETKSRRVDLAEFIVWARACQVAPEDALRRYMALAYPEAGKASQRQYPTGSLPHFLAREGVDGGSCDARASLQALLSHCINSLNDAALKRFMALPVNAQKLELARVLLEQLAQPQNPPKPKRKRPSKTS